MTAGNRLLLYSDGVNEAMNSSLEEYGFDRIQDHMQHPDASVYSLLDDIRQFSGVQLVSDDITLVMIESKAV